MTAPVKTAAGRVVPKGVEYRAASYVPAGDMNPGRRGVYVRHAAPDQPIEIVLWGEGDRVVVRQVDLVRALQLAEDLMRAATRALPHEIKRGQE